LFFNLRTLSRNQQRTYWDQALDLPADERRAYLTQLDEVIKVVGMNQVSHIEELVQAVDAATPEKRALIQKYTQRIAAEFSSLNTRRNLVTALVYCGWRNAEECEVFVNAAVTLIRAFDKADISQASAYKLIRELKHHNSAYTDPSFVPDLLPSLFALRDVYCAQLMEHLDGADSASREQISRLVTEAFKDKCGSMLEVLKLINVGNLECVIKALKQIESEQEREEIVRIASPFVPHMRLAWQYADVIEALPSIASEKREEFVIRCVAAVQEHKENKRRLVAAIREAKKMLSGTSLAKRGRDEQAVSVGASSSASSSSSSVVDDVEEIVDAPLVASLSSSSSNDESDDEGTTSLKKARRN
jgi:transcription termination factor NusB